MILEPTAWRHREPHDLGPCICGRNTFIFLKLTKVCVYICSSCGREKQRFVRKE